MIGRLAATRTLLATSTNYDKGRLGMRKSAARTLYIAAKLCVLAAGILASSTAGADDDLMSAARQIFKPIPSIVPAVKNNPITHEKVALGKILFFDPRLSASGVISCNT